MAAGGLTTDQIQDAVRQMFAQQASGQGQQSLEDVLVGGGSGFLNFITQLLIAQLQTQFGREELAQQGEQFGLQFGFQQEQAALNKLFQLSDIFGRPRDIGRQAALIRQGGGGTALATAGAEGKSFVGPQFQQLIEAITNPQPQASISAAHGANFTLGAPHKLVNALTGQVTAELEAGETVKATPQKVEGQQPGDGTGGLALPTVNPVAPEIPAEVPGVSRPSPTQPVRLRPPALEQPKIPSQIFTPQEFEQVWSQVVAFLQGPNPGIGFQIAQLVRLAQAIPPAAQPEISRRLRELGRPELADALDQQPLESSRTLFQQTGQAPTSAGNLEDFLALGFVPAPNRLTRDLLNSLSFEGRERLSGGFSASGRESAAAFEDVLRFHPRSPQRQFGIQFGSV